MRGQPDAAGVDDRPIAMPFLDARARANGSAPRPDPRLGPEALQAGLRSLGYAAFRPGQERAVDTLLARGRLLYVAPTGGGKSLVYQLPALLLPGTSLVVSPLVALMQDQVQALSARGVPATFLAATLGGEELERRLRAAARGEYRLLYVAPERLTTHGFTRLLRNLACPLVAIDEAHCISEWGHDFRPEYLQIGALLSQLPAARVLACTATATPVVRDEIVARLALGADTPQIVHGFARPNLVLRAAELSSNRERDPRVDEMLQEALGAPNAQAGAAIIYSPTRNGCQDESERLARKGWRVGYYHAGLEPSERERTQQRFTNGELQLVVATNAFGMGIDRGDVRLVVHLAPPPSLESYYQEVGRAGRDGERAYGLLLTAASDLALRRRLIESGSDGEAPPAAVIEHKWGLFLELMRWVEGGSCRHDAILRYFGDQEETLGGCGQCDICSSLAQGGQVSDEELQLIVRKALSGVARVHGRYGLSAAVKLLRGVSDERLTRRGLERVRTFGVLKGESEDWLTRLIRRLVTAGLVVFAGDDRPVVLLTDSGRAVMEGKARARVLLPDRVPRASRARSKAARAAGQSTPVRFSSEPVVQRTAEAEAELDEAGVQLFEALRAHRLTVARAEAVPPFVVASDRTLRDMARIRPQTEHELLTVHGMGPVKAARYGEGFLALLRGRE
jgi:ATP-dependent DNA helicase RecQ